ncbi:hypothetical protein FQN54_007054 [Arachnomyces sp. PD_36]|nr:hypothetical protein FQN54_007054 [Arachnomyces sp. PD_36]
MASEKTYLEANVRYSGDGLSDIDEQDNSYGHATRSYPRTIVRPIVDYLRNEWRTSAKYGLLSKSKSTPSQYPRGVEMLLSIVTAPRFRRYILVYFVMLSICWFSWTGIVAPRLKEHGELMESLDINTMEAVGGWFGTNAIPRFTDMVHMKSLDSSIVPGSQALSGSDPNRRRVVIVGDAHGHTDELQQLLENVSFDSTKGDHLIFTGNMISNDLKSPSIIELARQHRASCVRGANEDRVLLVRRQMATSNTVPLAGPTERPGGSGDVDHMDQESFSQGDYKERALAALLAEDQINWLESCPVILRIGQIKGMGETVVVHSGLVPGVELASQDPASVMNMRTIDLKSHVPSASEEGMPWQKLFNKYQSVLLSTLKKSSADISPPESRTTTVFYGNSPDGSLNLGKYTKGLDTGCSRGGKLSAMVITDGGKQETVQVNCKASI